MAIAGIKKINITLRMCFLKNFNIGSSSKWSSRKFWKTRLFEIKEINITKKPKLIYENESSTNIHTHSYSYVLCFQEIHEYVYAQRNNKCVGNKHWDNPRAVGDTTRQCRWKTCD